MNNTKVQTIFVLQSKFVKKIFMQSSNWRQTLKLSRKKSGKSQSDIALKLNKTQQTIANWESGKADPSVTELIAFTNLVGISMGQLFGDVQIIDKTAPITKDYESTGNRTGNSTGNTPKAAPHPGQSAAEPSGVLQQLLDAKQGIIESQQETIQTQKTLLDIKNQEVAKLSEENERLKRAIPELGKDVESHSGQGGKKNIA
ncbi:helix-turn-helix transcriptional regulator [Chitinophaga agrisoli]|uniref:Helix-turn-helix transcriptional regulator n=1 Tax=Chitinophaga agrisoli TaxID=2607653 RepID=A0A5B2W331_9BACT|nr:helix-turn-helix transcriptional regulator [Chitinophaga agrisoli]KAA2245524.1 helix-turn-helix transcriptional regulator [Chitinophaga agrisoli]